MTDLVIDGVTKSYGAVTALDDVSFTVDEGTTFGLLGTNGAGKTTLLRLLIGLEAPDAGSVRVAGLSANAGTEIRRRVGYLPEDAGFPPSFSGREVLEFHADMRGVASDIREKRIAAALTTVGLDDAANRPVGEYSNGMHRRLGLATVLLTRPHVLLLDEPTAGLDPMGIDAFNGIVERIGSNTDITIVFSSHSHAEVERVCSDIAILDEGHLRAVGSIDDLRRDVGETVTVDCSVGTGTDCSTISDRLEDESGTQSVTVRDDGSLEIQCLRAETYSVLASVHETADVDGFEVREPGLEDVFRAVIDGETPTPSAAESARGEESS